MIEARDSSVPKAEKAGQPPEGKGIPPKDLERQKEKSWDTAEYAVYCHMCGALSEIEFSMP